MRYFQVRPFCNSERSLLKRAIGSFLGLTAAFLMPELPDSIHPVAAFGRLMQRLERSIYPSNVGQVNSDTGPTTSAIKLTKSSSCSLKYRGVAYNLVGILGSIALGYLFEELSPFASTIMFLEVTAAPKALYQIAGEIGNDLVNGNVDRARTKIRGLVSRDTKSLQPDDIIRASIASVAENTVDAITAPLFYAITVGPAGVLAYRAVNTLDAMVGYRNERYREFGWFSARLDDMANWVPARITIIAVALTRPAMSLDILRHAYRHGADHPSPNAGRVEAAFAYALGVKLGGMSSYDGEMTERPVVGRGDDPNEQDIERAIELSVIASIISAALIVSVAMGFVYLRGYFCNGS